MTTTTNSPSTKEMAERLGEKRRRLGLNPRQMAKRLDMEIANYVQMELRERGMDATRLAGLARHGVDIGYVLSGVSTTEEREFMREFKESRPIAQLAATDLLANVAA
uniref:HTH cro/C1-type domain-containing protein n=1 Tax=Candidatus Kentrum sp. LFY TaxID=2126342 RepID=A0A450VCM0_9GAMM|nr:MAG: hypothetical protein BECKLFY1418A_GA0070994_12043 [Candidatus Kentron sp. LFY]